MIGIGFILHDTGWSCSNTVDFDVEYDRILEDGQKKSKHTSKLKFNCIFDGHGDLNLNLPVYCIFKDADKGDEKAFAGLVTRIQPGKVEVTIKVKSDKLIEIKQKIQSWQHKLTY